MCDIYNNVCFLRDMDYTQSWDNQDWGIYQAGHGQLDGCCSELQFICSAPQLDVVYIRIQVHIVMLCIQVHILPLHARLAVFVC